LRIISSMSCLVRLVATVHLFFFLDLEIPAVLRAISWHNSRNRFCSRSVFIRFTSHNTNCTLPGMYPFDESMRSREYRFSSSKSTPDKAHRPACSASNSCKNSSVISQTQSLCCAQRIMCRSGYLRQERRWDSAEHMRHCTLFREWSRQFPCKP